MVFLEVKVPEGTSARELRVTIEPSRLKIERGRETLFDEELYMKICVHPPRPTPHAPRPTPRTPHRTRTELVRRADAVCARPWYVRAFSCGADVGSNVDEECSLWELADKRVVIFHLVKWHRLAAGNVRDSSRTWWRKCLTTEEAFENTNPHGEYYNQKDK